jgi:20S proteasome alpha/beta subunit
MSRNETLDIAVRREGDYVVLEFLDAKCQCWSQREECYSTGYIRLTPQEAIRLAKHILQAAVSKKLNK